MTVKMHNQLVLMQSSNYFIQHACTTVSIKSRLLVTSLLIIIILPLMIPPKCTSIHCCYLHDRVCVYTVYSKHIIGLSWGLDNLYKSIYWFRTAIVHDYEEVAWRRHHWGRRRWILSSSFTQPQTVTYLKRCACMLVYIFSSIYISVHELQLLLCKLYLEYL